MNTQKSTKTKHIRNKNSEQLGQNTQDATTGEKGGVIEAAQDGSAALQDYLTTHQGKCATISITEAAEILGCARSTIAEAIKRKQIPVLRLGTSIRIPIPALKRVLETGDANPMVTEYNIRLDQRMAETVADMVTRRLLELENKRLVGQIEELGGSVRI